jgi:hypothetical protein
LSFFRKIIFGSKTDQFLMPVRFGGWMVLESETLSYLGLLTSMFAAVGRRMSLKLVAGMLNDLTPEQMAIFNECLVRG